MPKLTIITVNLNNANGLKKTMESVFGQTFSDKEYLVIDGGSNDGSKELIKENSDKITYWISERDSGIYNAMNKGILKAKGDYLLFLNSGDYLLNNEVVSQLFSASEGEDIVYGTLVVDDNGKLYNKDYPEKLNFSYFLTDTLPHSCTFIKRQLFTQFGLYNESLKTTSDWEFFLNMICKSNATYKQVPLPFTVFNLDGISSQKENWGWIMKDKKEVLKNNYSAFLEDYERWNKCEIELKDASQQLINIQNSRFWKMRNVLFNLKFFKSFSKKGK